MDNFLIAWLLLTPMVFLFGAALLFNREKRDRGVTSVISTIMFVFPFWAVFFIIRALN